MLKMNEKNYNLRSSSRSKTKKKYTVLSNCDESACENASPMVKNKKSLACKRQMFAENSTRSMSIGTIEFAIAEKKFRKESLANHIGSARHLKYELETSVTDIDAFSTSTEGTNESKRLTFEKEKPVNDITVLRSSIFTENSPDSNRRSTFGLEGTVTDIKILKRNSVYIPNVNASPALDFSNVTGRSAFRKSNYRSEFNNTNGTPMRKLSETLNNESPPQMCELQVEEDNSDVKISPSYFEVNKSELNEKRKSIGHRIKQVQNNESSLTKGKNVIPLKKTITRKKGISKSAVNDLKPILRTRLPNFSLIHKKANEKLENLEEFLSRKRERAEILLSGAKPPCTPSQKKYVGTPYKGIAKKQLSYKSPPITDDQENTTKSKNPASLKNVGTLKNPLSKYALKQSSFSSPAIKQVVRNPYMQSKEHTEDKRSQNKNITPVLPFKQNNLVGAHSTPNISAKKTISRVPLNEKTSRVNLKIREQISKIPVKCSSIKENMAAAILPSREGCTKVGNTKPRSKIDKKILIDCVANKKPNTTKSYVNQKRECLKGVRSNRRFELLMKMRQNEL